uniref:Homeobox domain-containing protein n=1 Tax=Panagrellus redivivus TaxID=6233 RepID=A0A7E4ULA4_PANRE
MAYEYATAYSLSPPPCRGCEPVSVTSPVAMGMTTERLQAVRMNTKHCVPQHFSGFTCLPWGEMYSTTFNYGNEDFVNLNQCNLAVANNDVHSEYGMPTVSGNEKPPLAAIGEVIELIGQTWTMDYGSAIEKPMATCQVCCQGIQDQYMMKIGQTVCHEKCATCCLCQIQLTDKCYEKNGSFYCQVHYYSEYSPYRCAGCGVGISPNDMVYKLKNNIIYHVSCHCCYHCGKHLVPGEQIVIDPMTKSVTCMAHSTIAVSDEVVEKPVVIKKEAKNIVTSSTKTSSFDSSSNATTSGPSVIPNGPVIPQYPFEMYAFGEMYSDDGRLMKRRGPRTTIKQNQLDVLNQIFSSTPKPSKHARAKLALETGLSMRVIQVWFQNRRSKERRLKHLCNFLRHYESKGLMPPPFGFNEDGTVITTGGPFSPNTLQSFAVDEANIYDDDSGELSS